MAKIRAPHPTTERIIRIWQATVSSRALAFGMEQRTRKANIKARLQFSQPRGRPVQNTGINLTVQERPLHCIPAARKGSRQNARALSSGKGKPRNVCDRKISRGLPEAHSTRYGVALGSRESASVRARSKRPYDRLQVCSEPSDSLIPSIVGTHGAGAGQPKLRTCHWPCHGTCTLVLWVMAWVTTQSAPNGPRVPVPMLFLAIVLP